MEARLESGSDTDREATRQSKALEQLSAKYGLASRAMSLVAVVKRKGDKPGDVPKTMVVPVGMPQDTAFGAYFGGEMLRESAPLPMMRSVKACYCMDAPEAPSKRRGLFQRVFSRATKPADTTDDLLVQLAGCIEPDGGMPGKDDEERWVATATALLCFLAEGHTVKSGAFRAHVKKLLAFLKAASSLATEERKRQLVELVEAGASLSGDWLDRARVLVEKGQTDAGAFWNEAERAMKLVQARRT